MLLPLHLLLSKEPSLSLSLATVFESSTLLQTEISLTQSQETMCKELMILNFLTTGFLPILEAKSKRLSLNQSYLRHNKVLTRFTLLRALKDIQLESGTE